MLSPLDMLMMPDDEQKILNVITRFPNSSPRLIAKKSGLQREHVDCVLTKLVRNDSIVSIETEDGCLFALRYKHTPTRIRNARSILDLFSVSPTEST